MLISLENSSRHAEIDDEDFDKVSVYKWRAIQSPNETKEYIRGLYNGTVPYGMDWQVSLHRVVMNAKKGDVITFIDRNPFNCKKENLRLTNRSNLTSRQGKKKHQKYKNVFKYSDGNWYAALIINGKYKYSRGWRTPKDAAHAYDLLALKHLDNDLVNLNFPKEIYKNGSIKMLKRKSKADSGYFGVVQNHWGSYTSYIMHNSQSVVAGVFHTKKNAAIAHDYLLRKLYPNNKDNKYNFPDLNYFPVENNTVGVFRYNKTGNKYVTIVSGEYCGSYNSEKEAAIAHDTWAMKLSKRTIPKLNYPDMFMQEIIKRIIEKYGEKK